MKIIKRKKNEEVVDYKDEDEDGDEDGEVVDDEDTTYK